jgi:hypothetical protein
VSYDGRRMEPRRLIISRKQENLYRSDHYLVNFLVVEQEAKGIWPDLTLKESLRIERSLGSPLSSNVFNGRYVYEGKPKEKSPAKRYFRANGPEAAYSTWDINALAWVNLFDLGVNNARIKETITRLPVNPEYPDWIGIKIHYTVRERYSMDHELWIDPKKDNLVMHYTRRQVESLAAGHSRIFELDRHILETAQTPNKQWYPVHIEIREQYPGQGKTTHHDLQDIRILMDTNWTTSEPVFNKDYLFN